MDILTFLLGLVALVAVAYGAHRLLYPPPRQSPEQPPIKDEPHAPMGVPYRADGDVAAKLKQQDRRR